MAALTFQQQQLLYIGNPELEVTFEFKSGFLHLIPTFHRFVGEEPNKHLKEFHMVCTRLKLVGVAKKDIKMRAFPFSLANSAKE